MNFWRTVEILGKRKWLIALSVIVAVALTFGATRIARTRWEAMVTFVVPQSANLGGSLSGGDSAEAEASTPRSMEGAKAQAVIYSAIVRSQDVLEPSLKAVERTQVSPEMLKTIEFVAIAPRLFQLRVQESAPARAKALANVLAENFEKVYKRLRTQQAENTLVTLKRQLAETDGALHSSRRNYDTYRNQHQIVGTLTSNLDIALNRQKDAKQKHDEAGQHLADEQARLLRLQTEISSLPETVTHEIPATTNLVEKQIREELATTQSKIDELKKRYTDAWPEVKTWVEKKEAIATRLRSEEARNQNGATASSPNPRLAELRKEESTLKQNVAGTQARVASLGLEVGAVQAEISGYRGLDSQLNALLNELSRQTESRNSVATRLNLAQQAYDSSNSQTPIAIMDKVSDFNPPINPTPGRTLKLILLAGLCALLGTSSIIIALDTIDRRLRTVKEAEIALPAPLLAAIPQPMGKVTYASLARVTELVPRSLHAESFRFLGIHLLSGGAKGMRSIMSLSAKAEQGSTTTLTNLGITLAQAGKRVILVDANIRTPELHLVFELPSAPGYTDLLASPNAQCLGEVLRPTSIKNLQVITSGRQPNNVWEMFRSNNLAIVAHLLEDQADYILYDTPSAVLFTDALNLAPVTQGAFLCVRALEPLMGAEDRLVKTLEEAGVKILGCVLTDVPASVVEGYKNYQHYYHINGQIDEIVAKESSPNGLPSLPLWIEDTSHDNRGSGASQKS